MKPSILISTTNSIEGMEIEKYYDLISTNVVLGTNILSDIGASFSDLFGGTSDIYQNKLDSIYKIALDKLRMKAKSLYANGVIGVKIDFDEISGGGKSMFMISVSGTAVRLKSTKSDSTIGDTIELTVLPEDLQATVEKIKIIDKIKRKIILSDQDWEFLIENPISDTIPELMEIYLNAFKDSPYPSTEEQKRLRRNIPLLLRQVQDENIPNLLYEKISENTIVISTLIKETDSFSPDFTLAVLKSTNIHAGIATLYADKRFYIREDIEPMNSILDLLDNLPDTGKVGMVKGILGSKEKFVCENNHQNDVADTYCESCGRNIKGLIVSEVEEIKDFKLKVDALKLLLA